MEEEDYSLCSRVIQLELLASPYSEDNGGIPPQLEQRFRQRRGKVLLLQERLIGIRNNFSGGLVRGLNGEAERVEGLEDNGHALDNVGKYDFLVRESLLVGVFAIVHQFHLLEDGRLHPISRQRCVSGWGVQGRREACWQAALQWVKLAAHLARLSSTEQQDVDLLLSLRLVLLQLPLDLLVS